MKHILFFVMLAGVLNVMAQEDISVRITQQAVDSSMQPAFVVEIPQASSKSAIKMWEERLVPRNLFSTFKRIPKMEKEDKEKWIIRGVVIDEITPDTLDVYTRITSLKDRILFATMFKSENGFIGNVNENTELCKRATDYVRSHAVEVYRQAVSDELDDLEKEVKKMEKDYDGYNKDNRKLEQKSKESQSTLNILNSQGESSLINFSDEQKKERKKEIEKEEKALKKYSKQKDKNLDQQKKLEKEIEQKKEEIKTVQKKLQNIK